jgi:hypothetical protein
MTMTARSATSRIASSVSADDPEPTADLASRPMPEALSRHASLDAALKHKLAC